MSISEAIDFKLAAVGLITLILNFIEVENFYKGISFVIFVGYNLHRWYIMHKNYQKSKNETNQKP